MTATDSPSAFLGMDYGLRRIGLAVGDTSRFLAFAQGTHVEGKDGSIFKFLARIIESRNISTLILGLPLKTDGSDGEITTRVRRFALRLEEEFKLPVILWDERYSSQEADRWLKDKRSSTKEDRDALAAEIILQSYLDSLRPRENEE